MFLLCCFHLMALTIPFLVYIVYMLCVCGLVCVCVCVFVCVVCVCMVLSLMTASVPICMLFLCTTFAYNCPDILWVFLRNSMNHLFFINGLVHFVNNLQESFYLGLSSISWLFLPYDFHRMVAFDPHSWLNECVTATMDILYYFSRNGHIQLFSTRLLHFTTTLVGYYFTLNSKF